MPLPAHTHNNM